MNVFTVRDLVREITSYVRHIDAVKTMSLVNHLFYDVLRDRLRYGKVMTTLQRSFSSPCEIDADSLYVSQRCKALRYIVKWRYKWNSYTVHDIYTIDLPKYSKNMSCKILCKQKCKRDD
jgi:hypothetical protein